MPNCLFYLSNCAIYRLLGYVKLPKHSLTWRDHSFVFLTACCSEFLLMVLFLIFRSDTDSVVMTKYRRRGRGRSVIVTGCASCEWPLPSTRPSTWWPRRWEANRCTRPLSPYHRTQSFWSTTFRSGPKSSSSSGCEPPSTGRPWTRYWKVRSNFSRLFYVSYF